jgi:N-acetylglucosamine-6-sulfatase
LIHLTRRDFLKVAGTSGGALILSACQKNLPFDTTGVDRTPDSPSPNIILILTDDQPSDTLSVMPTVQRDLVGGGIEFTNGFVTTPLCSPSRASIYSGLYAHHHGVLTNRLPDGGAKVFDDSSTVATWLHDVGYRTAFIGKYINGYDEEISPLGYIPPGWDDWRVFIRDDQTHRFYLGYSLNENGKIVKYGTDDADYSADVMAEKAVDFIEGSRNQAFFMVLSFFAPHQPRTPAARHYDMFRTDEEISARRPPNFNEEDVSDKPEWLQSLEEPVDPDRMDKVYQSALRSLISVDDAIAEVLAALDKIGQRENTAIIYLSDNSVAWGEHRLPSGKNCSYEECIKVPFVISYPPMIQEPRQEDRMVLNIDLAPTIAEIAGAQIPNQVDGASLVSILNDPTAEWRDQFLIEHWPTNEGFGSTIPGFTAIRTEEWKYVEYENGETELYDLVNDPYEMTNLAGGVQYESTIQDLKIRLAALRE